ncbi:hypothetical protein MKW94_019954 [Papaver nudicaule]|uniref:Uncharacterized protein n=1 Tax=Papaver nudicaule TaxID=74823 RepID=A0AA41VL90_PAPNU|nr:hypothetical protein [Papaver nudicaule]
MDEEEFQASGAKISEENLYPMYFGVSCAFVALELLSRSRVKGVDTEFAEIRDRMLQGSTHLLGLLVWRIQKREATEERSELLHNLEKAETEVAELKKRRSEDSKANEKVVRIFASQEQSWFNERKKLRQQIGALLNELRVSGTKKEEAILELNTKIKDRELLLESRIKILEQEEQGKRKELEFKLDKTNDMLKEAREIAYKDTREQSSQLWKHKTALIELVSNQRQLEAEMGRTLRQLEASKEELDSVLKQKEESVSMVQKLSKEVRKMRKDSEQKDKILSAMLRKSKIDSAEKEILLKELKISKARRKQAEMETERWSSLYGSRHERSARAVSDYQMDSRLVSWVKEVDTIEPTSSHNRRSRSHTSNSRVHPSDSEKKTEREDGLDQRGQWVKKFPPPAVAAPIHWKMLNLMEGQVEPETERKTNLLEQRHRVEVDAFVEQPRLKDEKLEAFNWRFVSMELESKRLQSHIEGLGQDLSHLKEENFKLEAEQESGVISLKDEIASLQLHHLQYRKINSNSSPKTPDPSHEYAWSHAKVIREREIQEEPQPLLVRVLTVMESEKEEETPLENQSQGTISEIIESHEEVEVKKEVEMDSDHVVQEHACPVVVKVIDKPAAVNLSQHEKENHPWKMDLHSLGVFYKIKRLHQQLFMLDKMAGMQTSKENRVNCDNESQQLKTFLLHLMPLLNKQVIRYQTLHESTNNLCQRMCGDNVDSSNRDTNIMKTREEIKGLENFLEEMFQLQRYVVATGQKLIEIQSRMASELVCFSGENSEISTGFNMERFANRTSTLFREVQKGLEVRISRMIGELEGTLTCDGFIYLGH